VNPFGKKQTEAGKEESERKKKGKAIEIDLRKKESES